MTKSVVITGVGQGIGKAIFEHLHQAGWYTVGIERDKNLAENLAGATERSRGSVLHADVTDEDTFGEALRLARSHGPLGGWVNNAGVVRPASLHRATRANLRITLSVNLEATYWGCAAAVRAFMEQQSGGAIVNISSIHGRRGFAEHAAYDMSKGGVDALTRNVAVEYGPFGIRANAVAPGAIRTPALEQGIATAADPVAAQQALGGSPPLRRIGDANEIAAAVGFLLSDNASYLTGQSIAVDGGWTSTCGS